MNRSVKNRPEMIPKPNKNRDMPLPLSAILPDLKTGRTGQKIPENDTEKIQFSRPIRDTHGNGRTARLTDRKPELSESEKAELDYKLQMACDYPGEKPALTITYFVPDQRKAGGSYHTISGQIKKIDDYQKQVILMDKTRIDVDCILDIDGQIYEIANESETDFD